MAERIFGSIIEHPPASSFENRKALAEAGIHKPTQAGISYSQMEGADSIVLSGGYEDDEDYGDVLIYTGQGGQDPTTREQIADQELIRGNLALAVSCQQGLPVRVTRGAGHNSEFSPTSGYQYAGLYRVDSFWREAGKSGFQVYRFRMLKTEEQEIEDISMLSPRVSDGGAAKPGRVKTTVTRVVRDTRVSNEIKRLYDFTCQMCGTRLESAAGPYAEAAHIRPLGRPHDGPDLHSNILCLCPNHHVLFDYGSVGVADDFGLMGQAGTLNVHPKHELDVEHFRYHREHFGL